MEVVAVLAALAFTVNKVVSVVKGLVNGDRNTVVSQIVVWVVGTAAIWVAGQADVTAALIVPGLDVPLESLDFASVVLAGLMLGSSGSFAYDIRKSIDGSDSAAEKSLLS